MTAPTPAQDCAAPSQAGKADVKLCPVCGVPMHSHEGADHAPPNIAETVQLRTELGNLLAILHGDGGHYQAEQGNRKAIADAIEKHHQLCTDLETAQAVIKDDCETDTSIRNLARPIFGDAKVDGDSYSVPALEDIFELLHAENDKLREAGREALMALAVFKLADNQKPYVEIGPKLRAQCNSAHDQLLAALTPPSRRPHG